MTRPHSKKVHIKTYGCQMNAYDSARMAEILAGLGYGETADAGEADLVILNTCHIREKAAEKVYSEVGKLRRLKDGRRRTGADMVIAVAGCVAQAEGEELVKRARLVDLVFGPQTYHRLPELLARQRAGGRAVVETDFPAAEKFAALTRRKPIPQTVSAFLTVQEGCDKFCSFCVVPYTRGAEVSRAPGDIVAEAEALAGRGVREVTLLGQNVNAYHGEGLALAGLIARLARIAGLDRIRYTTSHPRDMGDDLIAAHGSNDKLMPYLHLPVQAGSDAILKAMNRGHTAEHYVRLVARVRAARPDVALSGDFIVGFPGETEADFEATLALVREVRYASAFTFRYSARPGTPAAERDDRVPEEVALDRLHRLQALITAQMQAFNRAQVGETLPVLLEKPGRKAGQLIGRSPYLQSVHLEAPSHLIGAIIPARIMAVGTNSLSGHYASQARTDSAGMFPAPHGETTL